MVLEPLRSQVRRDVPPSPAAVDPLHVVRILLPVQCGSAPLPADGDDSGTYSALLEQQDLGAISGGDLEQPWEAVPLPGVQSVA